MPEAPEVQTVLDTLRLQLQDVGIEKVEILYPKLIQNMEPDLFIKDIIKQHFRSFFRIGKYLCFQLDTCTWIVHLRMEGKFYIFDSMPEERKHIHAIFTLSDGRFLCYHDTRKFGRMALYPIEEALESLPCFKNVGLDCLDERVDGSYFYTHIHTLKKTIKQALLDQSIMAGVGNIYADEILFSSHLDPRCRCNRISKKDCENIIFHTKRIIRGAMKSGGTTIRSYTSSLGVTGLFQLQLKVHSRKDQPCPVCGSTIKKIEVAKRGTYLCPKCQKRK